MIDIKATLQNEDLKNPEVTAKITGHYMFNIGTSLCDSVELNSELSFSSEATGRGGEKIPFTVKMKGRAKIMTLTSRRRKWAAASKQFEIQKRPVHWRGALSLEFNREIS